MTYIVNENCIKCKYMDCVEVCPVDCFYEGENMLVIHPDECIDCGVCEPECPVELNAFGWNWAEVWGDLNYWFGDTLGTDIDESDQIGLTSFASPPFAGNRVSNDERLWDFVQPDRFDVQFVNLVAQSPGEAVQFHVVHFVPKGDGL